MGAAEAARGGGVPVLSKTGHGRRAFFCVRRSLPAHLPAVLVFASFCFASFAALPEAAADVFYVREDGSDSCDGTRDEAGTSGPCAFRTIGRCVQAAGCGDTCQVRQGEYFEDEIHVAHRCSEQQPLQILGAGSEATRWYAGLRELTGCEAPEGGGPVWSCSAPDGSLLAAARGAQCLMQRLVGEVPIADENGVSGDLVDYACVTPWADPDVDDDGTSDLSSEPGVYTPHDRDADGTIDGYRLHGWNGETPAETRFFAPDDGAEANSDDAILVSGRHVTIAGFEVLSGFYVGLLESGRNNTYRDLHFYGGGVWIGRRSLEASLEKITVQNNYRRPNDGRGTTERAWDRNSQSLAVQGRSFTIRDSEFFGAREGCGFSGFAGPGVVDGLSCHWHHNHNLKLIDDAHDIRITNCLSYNGQESLFLAGCVNSLVFRHCTFVTGTVVIHDDNSDGPEIGPTCPDADGDGVGEHGPANLDFYNNLLSPVLWNAVFGDPRANPGHDFDYNVYLEDWSNLRSPSYFHRDMTRDVTMDGLADWQGWEDDPCPGDCLRDPNSITSVTGEEFASFAYRDDSMPRVWDFDLRSAARSVGQGSIGYAPVPCRDLEGIPRTGAPDAGAYEREDAADAACISAWDSSELPAFQEAGWVESEPVGEGLAISKAEDGAIRLTWGRSCLDSDTDYQVYEGDLAELPSHTSRLCSTGGERSVVLQPAGADTYYLIVPTNGVREGSYGTDSGDVERPPGSTACLPQSIGECY